MKNLITLFIMAVCLVFTQAKAQQVQKYAAQTIEATRNIQLKKVSVTSFTTDSTLSTTDNASLPTSAAVAKLVNSKTTGLKTITFADTVNIDVANMKFQTITLTDTVVFTASNYVAGKELYLRIVPGAGIRGLTFPADWKWVGAAAPTSIAANKTGLLRLVSFGTTGANVVARYEVEQ